MINPRIARALHNRAMDDRYTALSFRTLDKHKRNGQFDNRAALRLLRYNVRDASRYIPGTINRATMDKAAKMLLETWTQRHGAVAITE